MSNLYKIYKISNSKTDECYFGSTTLKVKTRFSQHKSKSNGCRSRLLFEGNPEDVSVETILELETDDKILILQLERFYIERTENCINKNIPNRSLSEYKADFNVILKEKARQYTKEWIYKNKSQHKQNCLNYIKNNRVKWNEYQKEYKRKKRLEMKQKFIDLDHFEKYNNDSEYETECDKYIDSEI